MIRGYLAFLVASGIILERVEVPHALWEELSGVYITGLGQLGLLLTLLYGGLRVIIASTTLGFRIGGLIFGVPRHKMRQSQNLRSCSVCVHLVYLHPIPKGLCRYMVYT